MFFALFVILSVALLIPLLGAAWLLGDRQLTRRIKRELARYQYQVVSVNETRKKFTLPGKKRPLISFDSIFVSPASTREVTQFREVTFTKGDQTHTCLAAQKSVWYKKPVLYFNIELDTLLPKVYDNTDPQKTYRKTTA